MRIELFFKSTAELSVLASFMRSSTPFVNFNVPNKVRNDNILENCGVLNTHFESTADICAHYSTKNNKGKRTNQTVEKFVAFLQQAPEFGVDEVLLVSGGGTTKIAADSLYCLQHLARYEIPLNGVRLSVAFNPYYSSEQERCVEQARLRSKLETGLVSAVYLQFGTELDQLREGLLYIESLQQQLLQCDNSVENNCEEAVLYSSCAAVGSGLTQPTVLGSMFIPTTQLLNRFRIKPWAGMTLSEEFLSSVDNANRIVIDMLHMYSRFNVEPIVESPIKGAVDLEQLQILLHAADVGTRTDNAAAAKVDN